MSSERRREIKRRRQRRSKIRKLKSRLQRANDDRERRNILDRIRKISPEAVPAEAE